MTKKILITDYAWPTLDREREILEGMPAELVVAETGDEDELISLAGDVDAIMTCWKRVSDKVIDAAPNCRIIARYGIGLDNIDVAHATKLGIPVTNVPTFCLDEVAEHVLALTLGMTRRVVRFDRAIRSGEYPGVPFLGIPRLSEMVLGLIGYGNIGRRVGRKARGLDMKLVVHDPVLIALPPKEGKAAKFEEVLALADVLSVHTPLTDETRNMINDDSIAQMKPGSYLINTSRGGIVDLDAVLRALESGQLAGAGLDVYPDEPPDLKHGLFQHPHFVATPHASFYSESSVRELQVTASHQVLTCLTGDTPKSIVNEEYKQNPARFSNA